jgi:hypothetical protein
LSCGAKPARYSITWVSRTSAHQECQHEPGLHARRLPRRMDWDQCIVKLDVTRIAVFTPAT